MAGSVRGGGLVWVSSGYRPGDCHATRALRHAPDRLCSRSGGNQRPDILLTPETVGKQAHTIHIEVADRGDQKAVTVTVGQKDPKVPLEVDQAFLSVRDGDKQIVGCFVRPEAVREAVRFEFFVAPTHLAKSRFTFLAATATPGQRKDLPSGGGWTNYTVMLRDFARPPEARPEAPASSKVVVEGTSLTFDPKTCTGGRGLFFWGHGSCAVTVLGHQGGKCAFEYAEEVEMGTTVYLVRVPVDAGPVTVRIDNVTKGGSTYDWPVTSFPLDKAKVVRRGGGRGIWSYRVGDTDDFVAVHPSERRSEMIPREGDAVKFRFELFTGRDFKDGLPGVAFQPTAEFVAGSDAVWPWLRIAMEDMTVGDRRRVEVPAEVADGAKAWLPKGSKEPVLYLEVSLLSIGRGK